MSIVKAIYNVKPEYSYSDNEYKTTAVIKYNGQTYIGSSSVHPDDKDFASIRVGKNIALSRARIKAMKSELKREQLEYDINNRFYCKIVSSNDFKPIKILINAKFRCQDLRVAIKKEEHNLNKYLQGQAKAIESIRRFRSKQDITS